MRVLLLALLVGASCAHEPPPPAIAAPASPIVARIGSRTITLAEVDDAIRSNLYDERARSLDKLIDDEVVAAAARRANKTDGAFVADRAAERIPEITSEEAEQFYERNRDRMPAELAGKSFGELEATIIRGLTDQKRQEAAREIVAELRVEAGVKMIVAS